MNECDSPWAKSSGGISKFFRYLFVNTKNTSSTWTHFPSTQSQTRTVSSSQALTRKRLSWEKATDWIQPLCPVRTNRQRAVRGFHRRMVLSQEPDACKKITLYLSISLLAWHCTWEKATTAYDSALPSQVLVGNGNGNANGIDGYNFFPPKWCTTAGFTKCVHTDYELLFWSKLRNLRQTAT